jgi:hypothetical protein
MSRRDAPSGGASKADRSGMQNQARQKGPAIAASSTVAPAPIGTSIAASSQWQPYSSAVVATQPQPRGGEWEPGLIGGAV